MHLSSTWCQSERQLAQSWSAVRRAISVYICTFVQSVFIHKYTYEDKDD